MSEKTPLKTAYVVFACKRSGHPGVLNWFCEQHGNILHLNNVKPDHTAKQFTTAEGGLKGNLLNYGNATSLITNFEEFSMYDYVKHDCDSYAPVGHAEQIQHMVILRSFKNMVASTVARWEMNFRFNWDDKVDSYQEQLKAAQGKGHPFRNMYVILYDLWFEFPAYRKAICQSWNMPFTDEGIDAIPSIFGSSFDFLRFQGRAHEVNTLHRYEQCADNAAYHYYMQKYADVAQASDVFFEEQRSIWVGTEPTHAGV